jgi:hypothetical protein
MKLSLLLLPLVTLASSTATSKYKKGVHWIDGDREYKREENALLIACQKGYLLGKCTVHVSFPLCPF